MEFLAAIGVALLLGVQTSISPCPLATNVAAVSYIGRRAGHARAVLSTGLLYTLGRAVVYVVLAALIVTGLSAAHGVSQFVQTWMPRVMGPLLVLFGMVLLDLIELKGFRAGPGESLKERAEAWGVWGGGLLGVVFALSFCPISAVFFFTLLTLAADHSSVLVLPLVFGLGTALPAVLIACVLAFNAAWVGRVFGGLTRVELWLRRSAGVVLILVGVYYTLVHVFGVQLAA